MENCKDKAKFERVKEMALELNKTHYPEDEDPFSCVDSEHAWDVCKELMDLFQEEYDEYKKSKKTKRPSS